MCHWSSIVYNNTYQSFHGILQQSKQASADVMLSATATSPFWSECILKIGNRLPTQILLSYSRKWNRIAGGHPDTQFYVIHFVLIKNCTKIISNYQFTRKINQDVFFLSNNPRYFFFHFPAYVTYDYSIYINSIEYLRILRSQRLSDLNFNSMFHLLFTKRIIKESAKKNEGQFSYNLELRFYQPMR